MNIWADANGWPVPPIILLGCLVAEILYYRGWRMLVKAQQARQAAEMRAEAADKRAEAEAEKARIFAEKLRSLGIDPGEVL